MLILLSALTALCILAVIYPYALYPAVLALIPKRPIARGIVDAGDGSRFSLLFCAYNEAASLPDKIANLRELKLRYPELEILSFDDGSSDGSADMIERDAPFVRLIRGGGRNGKAHGMKLLAAEARGDLLVFTDANVLLHIESLDKLAACYADTEVGGVCGALHYMGADGSSTAAVGGLYWRLEELIKDLESGTGSVMGADGSIFSVRRALYPQFPDTVLDDFTVSMQVVFSGQRLIKSNDVIAYERLVAARSDEFSRKIRIAARAFHTHTSFSEKRARMSSFNQFKYFSHKTLRWFGGCFLIFGVIFSLTATALLYPMLSVLLALAVVICVLIGLRSSSGAISSLTEIMLAMIATLIGVLRSVRGHTFVTWSPAKSRD
ncbi:glycosyltransferase [Luteimonas terrae]|uniref:Glycosyltransferase n=1 Tax=Luteimonas terrae TaxID=1530191 RepID=A0A4R5U8R7_9GAMM|nr:glycosyltransferase [Luteimonas terrae]TDK30889.1 glycosyltransferase [Luteimonas terrae]